MSQKIFQIIWPVHVHLKTDKVDLKKRPPWKKFFLHFFSIDSSSRHEKRCQMLQTLFWLFRCSKNPRWHSFNSGSFSFCSRDVFLTMNSPLKHFKELPINEIIKENHWLAIVYTSAGKPNPFFFGPYFLVQMGGVDSQDQQTGSNRLGCPQKEMKWVREIIFCCN